MILRLWLTTGKNEKVDSLHSFFFQFNSILFVFISQSHNIQISEYTKDIVKIHGRCGCHYKRIVYGQWYPVVTYSKKSLRVVL